MVETADVIYIAEPKSKDRLQDKDVISKKEASLVYCKYATEYNLENGKKPWFYLLIPHDEITRTTSFNNLVQRYRQ